ncbi:MAG: 50S ribosomal protein L29 [Chloroflexi bacterium]|nr:MAG: 50S ribosomal protein L29 [Chloroflexota bacterium]
MHAREIRAMTTEEIEARLDEAYQRLFRLRFDWAAGQLRDNNQIRAVKRDIARMKTILRERELAAMMAAWQEDEGEEA